MWFAFVDLHPIFRFEVILTLVALKSLLGGEYPDRLCDLRSHASPGGGDIIIDADSICHIERET